ncbi:MAG: dehypoxanthine futalosine cyclase [Proteobacteria bacterium]|nr:MAG: dehypoxanthine futalosine cyclase [Pseudomonadota bacterium]
MENKAPVITSELLGSNLGAIDAPPISDIEAKVESGFRISPAEARSLWQNSDLLSLARMANFRRQAQNPGKNVTYLVDRNINYTNVCNTDCTFCGFYRHSPNHPESYLLPREIIGKKVEEALALGATRILLQGGHNDELPYTYYVELVSWIHKNYPIEINSFSPSEIQQMRNVSGKSYPEILMELKRAGMKGLPGGGAEILDDEIRQRVSPKKIRSDEWIHVMEIAQSLDLTTTATMVIGFNESIEHRLNHLQRLRDLQDRSLEKGQRGFNCFISWTLQFDRNTSLGRSKNAAFMGASATEYLRNVALCRIFLDNITHHQASWPTLGPDIAQVALHFGCDDIGSTMMEENVVSAAGGPSKSKWSMSPEELRGHIRGAGFTPAQRNSSFEILHIFESEENSHARQ